MKPSETSKREGWIEEIREFRGEYGFLSNFHRQTVLYQGEIYQSAEHAYQSCKTEDPKKKKLIMDTPTPGLAKRLGGRLSDYGVREWRRKSIQIMTEVVRAKFTNPILRGRLLDTGDKILIEGNRWGDDFWGIVPGKGGRNELGRILMQVRTEIREKGEAVDVPKVQG